MTGVQGWTGHELNSPTAWSNDLTSGLFAVPRFFLETL